MKKSRVFCLHLHLLQGRKKGINFWVIKLYRLNFHILFGNINKRVNFALLLMDSGQIQRNYKQN